LLDEYAASSGNLLWQDTFSSPLATIPTVGNNTIFLGYYDSNNLTAVSLFTGKSIWNFTAGKGEVLNSSPSYSNGSIFFDTLNGTAYRLTSTGQLVWKASVGVSFESTPAVADGLVFLGGGDGRLYALNATTGLVSWEYPSASKPALGSFHASPVVSINGLVYDGSGDNRTYAVVAASGSPVWNFTTSAPIVSSPVLNEGGLFVVNTAGNVYAFDDSARQFEFDWADCNNDGVIDIVDLVCVSSCFGSNIHSANWAKCKYEDFYLDGVVNIRDLVKVALLFGMKENSPFPGEGQRLRVMDPVWKSQCSYLTGADAAYCNSGNGYAGLDPSTAPTTTTKTN
jgi:outer membrane protein assembly factor BamB